MVLQPLHLLQFFISPQSDAWNFPAHFWFPVQLDTKACLLFPCNVRTPITLCHNESVDSCPPMLKEMQDPQQVFLLSLPPLFYPQLHSIHISKMLFYICYSFVERPITWRKKYSSEFKALLHLISPLGQLCLGPSPSIKPLFHDNNWLTELALNFSSSSWWLLVFPVVEMTYLVVSTRLVFTVRSQV